MDIKIFKLKVDEYMWHYQKRLKETVNKLVDQGFDKNTQFEWAEAYEIRKGLVQIALENIVENIDKIDLSKMFNKYQKLEELRATKRVYALVESDIWFSSDSETVLGIFSSKEEALSAYWKKEDKNQFEPNDSGDFDSASQWINREGEVSISIVAYDLNELN